MHFKTFFQQIRYFCDLSQYSNGFVYIKDKRGEVYFNNEKTLHLIFNIFNIINIQRRFVIMKNYLDDALINRLGKQSPHYLEIREDTRTTDLAGQTGCSEQTTVECCDFVGNVQ